MIGNDKPELYRALAGELRALLADERDWLANLANSAALIFARLPDLNWTGFYLLRGEQLVLGPFQGKPACVRIDLAQGVCGAAARKRSTVLVPDVHEYPGHIACDDASRSEIVVPMIAADERLLGVLDLDSPRLARFDGADVAGLQEVVRLLVEGSDFPFP
jgi:GAF domain-containing protein